MSHVTRMNESCHTYEWVMSHVWMSHLSNRSGAVVMEGKVQKIRIWMSHVAYMKESCRTYEWVLSHIWISHVAHMDESCQTEQALWSFSWRCQMNWYKWVMSHIWTSHVAHMNESCRTYERVIPHIWMSHVKRNRRCGSWAKGVPLTHKGYLRLRLWRYG